MNVEGGESSITGPRVVVIIGGVPAAGKSTLMRRFIKTLGPNKSDWVANNEGKFFKMFCRKHGVYILGKYWEDLVRMHYHSYRKV